MAEGDRRGGHLKTEITSNMEDYLEAIFEIGQETGTRGVRVTDVARRLQVSRPSVVGMIRHLVEHGLAAHDHYGRVRLTAQGKGIAREILHRHQVLRRFFEEVLGLDAEIAEADACRIEHNLCPETVERFIAWEEFREQGSSNWAHDDERFRKFLRERRKNLLRAAKPASPREREKPS